MYSSTSLMRPLLQLKSDLIKEVASLGGGKRGNLVIFKCLCASEIWPRKRHNLWWEWPYKTVTTVLHE